MITQVLVERNICKIKKIIERKIIENKYNDALELVSLAAFILYETNLYYMDIDLENYIECLASKVVETDSTYLPYEERVLIWDGFGLNNRGLIQIYLNALCRFKQVIYVTYADRKNNISDILEMLHKHNCEVHFLKRNTRRKEIEQFNDIIKISRPLRFIHYSLPDDVIAPVIMCAYEGKLVRYLINLTDQAFWLGAKCIDKCIEFREYGANISFEYREIDKKKIVCLPYYAVYNCETEFQGYPFDFDDMENVLIFSGGNIYKTISKGNEYYKIVDYILSKYNNAIFWYAGSGYSKQMKRLLNKYPQRAFHTGERKDLFQILKRCVFYLNTYPVSGGLMMQYAAVAGKIPLTLRHKNDGDGSGLLINQDGLHIEFDDIAVLKIEIDRLMSDKEYLEEKSKWMKSAVITPEKFNKTLEEIIQKNSFGLPLHYKHENTDAFQELYLERICKLEFYSYYARKNTLMLSQFPVKFVVGGLYKLIIKIQKKLPSKLSFRR